jgi:hypothetical protein
MTRRLAVEDAALLDRGTSDEPDHQTLVLTSREAVRQSCDLLALEPDAALCFCHILPLRGAGKLKHLQRVGYPSRRSLVTA